MEEKRVNSIWVSLFLPLPPPLLQTLLLFSLGFSVSIKVSLWPFITQHLIRRCLFLQKVKEVRLEEHVRWISVAAVRSVG